MRSISYESTKVQQTGVYVGPKNDDNKGRVRALLRRYTAGRLQKIVLTCLFCKADLLKTH